VYENNHEFEVGKATFLREGKSAAIIGSGITLHNALAAADILAKEGIKVSVIDPFTIKPMDVNAIKKAVEMTGGKLITVEDHYAYVRN
jgi:transketolase